MRDTGFIGVRLTGFLAILKTYGLTASQLEREISRRNLQVATISFGGPVSDPSQHKQVVAKAKEAMNFLKEFGANHLVVFPPERFAEGHGCGGGIQSNVQRIRSHR